MGKKRKNQGDAAFEAYFESVYGSRWPALREALTKERLPQPLPYPLLKSYYIDPASRIAAETLPVFPGDRVLDLCAAPGGKTLILASRLQGQGELTANDRSAVRRQRLLNVVDEHLPAKFRETVRITGHDATRWGLFESEVYDKVLLDAPCSSERHVMASPSHLDQWSQARTKHLAYQAFAMLAAGLSALKTGGQLLYSTCSISPLENESCFEKLVEKRNGLWEEVFPQQALGERLKFGWILLPDAMQGIGPLYYCLIRKIGAQKQDNSP